MGTSPRLLPHHFYMRIICKTLLIEQDINVKKYIAFSELVNLAVGRAITVTENEFVNFGHVFAS